MKQFKTLLALLLVIAFSIASLSVNAASNTNSVTGVGGYDLVAYHTIGIPTKGNGHNVAVHDGVTYLFANADNLKTFEANPEKYVPAYGGWCAYAVAKKGEKVKINPKTYEIKDGKLYLFYNSWGTNTLKSWKDENPEELRKMADDNWKGIMHSEK